MTYTTNISLPEELADLTKKQVEKGYYTSISEVIRDALRKLLFSSEPVPTFKMSKKTENMVREAQKNYEEGKTISLEDVDDLDKL